VAAISKSSENGEINRNLAALSVMWLGWLLNVEENVNEEKARNIK